MGFEIFGATARECWRLGGCVSGRTSSISNACQEGSESRWGVGTVIGATGSGSPGFPLQDPLLLPVK